MRYLKKFNEGFDYNKEWEDMSPEERKENSIPSEGNIDFIITKIKEEFPKERVSDKSDLFDIICWYEDKFGNIEDEDDLIKRLSELYEL